MKIKALYYFRWLLPICYLLVFLPIGLHGENGISLMHHKVEQVSEPVQASLIAEDTSVQPGQPFWVGVELKMADGWDTYWVNPGDSGYPTQIEWNLPEGFKAGPVMWPYPEKFVEQSLVAYGYTHSVLLMTQITPPGNIAPGSKVNINADVNWLACSTQCQPGNANLHLTLPVNSVIPQKNPSSSSLFAHTRELLPKHLSQDEGSVMLSTQAEDLVLNFQPGMGQFNDVTEVMFIPEQGEVIDHSAPQTLEKLEQGFLLNIKRSPSGTLPDNVKGVLLVSEKGVTHKKAIQIDTSISTMGTANSHQVQATPAKVEGVSSVWVALGFAFVGGLILNVMPCVLPVIALKIFGFVKMAQQKRSEILKHGGVFALGVLVSFWVLSGILLILRAYGQGVGWGFQLQEPMFVVILASVLFLLGLSLFGVFEFGTSLISLSQKTSSSSSPLGGSFMSGVLATLVATPCTGPLLGPALGFAMTLPPVMALAIFTSMGFGMAFPYLLFSGFPHLVRYLPKPGNWMLVFKQLMGFLMMGTVVWLVWVFGAQTGTMAIFLLLISFLALAVGAWIFGTWGTPSKPKLTRWISKIVALAILVVGGGGGIIAAKNYSEDTVVEIAQGSSDWQAYSPEKVAALRSVGTPVFVDFTAKWCLICQANKVILHSSEVMKAFKERGVVTMTADWTKRDEIISQELKKMGRTGVPVYALYPADEKQAPYILPQTLTGSIVGEYLNRLDSPSTTVYAD